MSTNNSRRRIWRPFTLTITGDGPFSGIVYVGVTSNTEPSVAKLVSAASERGVSTFLSLFADDVRLELEPRTFRSVYAARMAARAMVLDYIDRSGADKVLNRTHRGSGYWTTLRGLKQVRASRLGASRRGRLTAIMSGDKHARKRAPSGVPYRTIEAARRVGFDPLALVWLMWAAPSTPTPAALARASQRPTGRLQVLALALAHVMRLRGVRSDVTPSRDDEAVAETLASLDAMLSLLRQAWESDASVEWTPATGDLDARGA